MEKGTGIDMLTVLLYFSVVLIAGYIVSRKHINDSAKDFMTGGKTLNWIKTGLTLIAMSIDTGIMGVAGVGFVWGMAIQPNAVNLWLSAPLAAMFLIPIYWRTKIITTPELLEKRFNVSSRAFFSIIMSAYNVVILGTSIYLGALVLNEIFGWNLYLSSIAIIGIVGIYVMMGGMKTVLSINIYQSIFITFTLFTVGIMCFIKIGGISGFLAINQTNSAGLDMISTKLPVDFDLSSNFWYPLPTGLIWAAMAGSAWIACNFGMVQRLLAAKNEKHAQKAILFAGAGHVITFSVAYMIGVSIQSIDMSLMPDKSYIYAVFEFFPPGIRGLLIAGLLASLISTIDGLLTSSSTLITQDIFLRFIKPSSTDRQTKLFARIIQATAIILALALILPFAMKSTIVTQYIQSLVADLFGVIISLFLVGIFSTRATPKAAFISMVAGLTGTLVLDIFTDTNFVNVGVFSFALTTFLVIVLSRFEKPQTREELENLTVFTLTDTKGPWIGLKTWPSLWKWLAGIIVGWWGITIFWEYLVSIF